MPAPEVSAWIALGSNLGDRNAHLEGARQRLGAIDGIAVVGYSVAQQTAPLGGADQPMYLNQMAHVRTTLTAETVLECCHAIERAGGRVRGERWASRTLDLDLVRYGDVTCDRPGLTLPHPGLRDRTFWAHEIAALEFHD